MEKKDLLQLEKMSTLKPTDLEKLQPGLFNTMLTKAGQVMKLKLEEQVSDAPEEVKKSIGLIDFSNLKLIKTDIRKTLAEKVLNENLTEERKKALEEAVVKIPALGTVSDILLPELPVFMNPLFQKELQSAKMYRLNAIAGIEEKKFEKLLTTELNLNNIDQEQLSNLVREKTLSPEEASRLAVVANMNQLVDGNFNLTEIINQQKEIIHLTDLVKVNNSTWKQWIENAKVELSEEITADEYADFLSKKVENLFPEESLQFKLSELTAIPTEKNMEMLEVLRKDNQQLFSDQPFDSLKLPDVPAADIKNIRTVYDQIDKLIKVNPGLDLTHIINNDKLDLAGKEKKVFERLDLINRFYKQNSAINYLNLEYKHDSDDVKLLDFKGFSDSEKNMVLKNIKAQQRIFSFTQDTGLTEKIMSAGYHSSYHIASVTEEKFITDTRLDTVIGNKLFREAHLAIIRAGGIMGTIIDVVTGSFDWTTVGNTGTDVSNYFRDIPGYQDLFGKMDFCDCAHCQSIYSPAAYFVDLMQFIEKNITSKNFAGTKSTHVLNLKTRRPDLWTLELNCQNTSELIPYLDIINEVLENFIAQKKSFSGNLSNRPQVENFVYKNIISLEGVSSWRNEIFSFRQPFHLPLTSVATYLRHFEHTRESISVLLQKSQALVSKNRFNLSDKELELITKSDTTPAFLNRLYGIIFSLSGTAILPFDVQQILKPLNVDRKSLGRLIAAKYITGSGFIVIRGEKKDVQSLQNDIEKIHNLNYTLLDRLHRFVRLCNKTGLTIEEQDHLMTILKEKGINDINEEAVTLIGKWLFIKDKYAFTFEELVAVIHKIPQQSLKVNEVSLFDKMFNPRDIASAEGNYPKNSIRFIHPDFIINRNTTDAEFSSSRLTTALNISDAALKSLITYLAQQVGAEVDADEEVERGFLLTTDNLSLLYRHHLLAAKLKLSYEDLFRFIKLINDIPHGYIQNDDQLLSLIDWYSWWKTSSSRLDDLSFMLKKEDPDPVKYPASDEISEKIISEISRQKQVFFADTVFSYVEGITEEQSKLIIAANNDIIEPVNETADYWLKTDFDPSVAIVIPAGIDVPEPLLRTALYAFHSQSLIPSHLTSFFEFSESFLQKLITALEFDLADQEFLAEIQERTSSATKLTELIEAILPVSMLLKSRVFTEKSVNYFIDHLSLFEIADLKNISLNSIRLVSSYSSFITAGENINNSIDNLNNTLDTFTTSDGFRNVSQRQIALVLQSNSEALSGINGLITGFTNSLKALLFLKDVAGCCSYIGVNAAVLEKIVSTDYDQLNQASFDLLGAFRSKYSSESERAEKLEKYQDIIRGRKRASLTTLLIHAGFPQFEDTNDLYNFFLVDTELEGCARTSRMVAATMSLQLYIHRILMNLEQDAQEPGTAGRIHVQLSKNTAEEWEWRKNYRVWEANRKIFLYPENYIEPDLRDDKTPLFEELEKQLLQQEINPDTVLDAYAKYMRGFDELAHLKIAGSFHEKDEETKTDVLHLLGVSSEDPCTYYYRRIENIFYAEKVADRGVIWGPWEKMNVQIPVRKVAPVIFNGRLHIFWVNVTSIANSTFDNNRSYLTGYSHKMSIEFTTLKLDGSWTAPQKLNLRNTYPFEGNGVIKDPLVDQHEMEEFNETLLLDILRGFPFFNMASMTAAIEKLKTPRYAQTMHKESMEDYTLNGFLWDQVFPFADSQRIILSGAGYQLRAAVDLYDLKIQNSGSRNAANSKYNAVRIATFNTSNKPGKIIKKEGSVIYGAVSPTVQLFDNFAYGSLLVNTEKNNFLFQRYWSTAALNATFDNVRQNLLITLPAGAAVQIVNGIYSDAVIDTKNDLLMLQGAPVSGDGFLLKRIGTTLSETLTRTLFTSGIDTALSIEVQKGLKERVPSTYIFSTLVKDKVVRDKIDWTGAYGTYYREIFFHIPFLLANHLNSQGRYADAQKWYHYIFNPGSTEVINYPTGATAAQKRKLALDRNWQYLEFRNIDVQTLRDQLSNKTAIETYKRDPFNPHAIARLRLSAYQKTIVMKYIDNLLDWADHLFTQDTMESVNEATLLYVIAREILGDKPVQTGDCGEGTVSPKNYQSIQPLLNNASEFLAELETYTVTGTTSRNTYKDRNNMIGKAAISNAAQQVIHQKKPDSREGFSTLSNGYSVSEYQQLKTYKEKGNAELESKAIDDALTGKYAQGVFRGNKWKEQTPLGKQDKIASFGWSFVYQVSPVFCIPGNKDLLDYYDRVDDRLFKLRNCMNISGQKRQLALFSPEIDPRVLVRAKAAGISIEDLLSTSSGNLPPYRFAYLLEKAKAFTGIVQSFGSSLMSAIEKKNIEELSLIRMTQQQNLLELSTKSRELEIKAAEETVKTIHDRIISLNYQINYYNALITENRNGYEIEQTNSKMNASSMHASAAIASTLAAVLALIPQVGAMTAMKYGGAELHSSIENFAGAQRALGQIGDNISTLAGMEAGFLRRSEGWIHQKTLLQHELIQTEKTLIAAEIRRDILIESHKLHLKSIEHNQEVLDFFGERFTNIGLYTWLSSTMQQVYKDALNNAQAIARMAELAYKYERDDTGSFIEGTYFDSSKAGLLGGEKLMMALQTMERKYIETNYRKNEIDQTFSLTQINPAALLSLKQTGSCEFEIPELYFDLFYPGHYRRRIQSVRLTIPSVTGPYTNISATLSLQGSKIRMNAKIEAAALKDVPKSRTTIIATSTAQNDAGVFQVNFRDERYMPFEGAGAVSRWKMSLPKTFRQFDYQTINDVMIHISYTAEYDEVFRDEIEDRNNTLEGTLLSQLSAYSLKRVLSLRQEFSTDFHRLTEQPVNSPILFKIQNKHFPLFLNGKNLKTTRAKLVLVTTSDQTVNNVTIKINGTDQTGFTRDVELGNLYSKDLGNVFAGGLIKDHSIEIVDSGELGATTTVGPVAAFDSSKLLDIILYVEYGLA